METASDAIPGIASEALNWTRNLTLFPLRGVAEGTR
jgi:hypothetical protein